MPSSSVSGCCEALAERGWKIAFAECATAGRMCAEFALAETAGMTLLGGIVCYASCVKENILKIPDWVVRKYSPESPETTESLAVHTAAYFEADVTVAVTGLLAGGSESPDKPVGTVFLHILYPGGTILHREVFFGDPEAITLQVIDKVAELLHGAF